MEIIGIVILAILILIVMLLIIFRKGNDLTEFNELQNNLVKIEAGLKEEFRLNRSEIATIAKDNRTELNDTIRDLKSELSAALQKMNEQSQLAFKEINRTLDAKVTAMTERSEASSKSAREELANGITNFSLANIAQLEKINQQAAADAKQMRDALAVSFKNFQETFTENIRSFNDLQKEKFNQLDARQTNLIKSTEEKLESIQNTVGEKLEKTLSERLGQSFDTVGKQLIEVQKGLGEMQTLAQDVGGLKRVLSNVKMRGGFGEVQLHMLLESILAPEQYEANIATKQNSSERVEYAVKFPNKEGEREYVWLPIDAKFPKDAYENLQTAYDSADPGLIESAQKMLETVIKKMARDICDKYIDAPNTTNFGIMFLPFEGLFAEVVRKASLLEQVQRECNVIITGPTTLAVILNSLQMGFRTLAIQKRSSEVWQVLSAVKKEFNQFGGMLDKAQKNIQTGLNQLDDVVGVRTRAIQRQLKGVETMKNVEENLEISDLADDEFLEGVN